jgi:hypothetical protein
LPLLLPLRATTVNIAASAVLCWQLCPSGIFQLVYIATAGSRGDCGDFF